MADDLVTIHLPPVMAEILRDVCEEWLNDHARFSKATLKMTKMFLSVILEEIEKQVKADKPEEKARFEKFVDGPVKCPTCNKEFKNSKGLATHCGRMGHQGLPNE